MKIIKSICLLCFLIFGIIMQSEIFQDELWNFSTAYFQASRYEVANEDMSRFVKDASDIASQYDVHIFAHYNEVNNNYCSTLHIFGNDEVIRQTLKDTANVEEKVYTAFISGITNVEYHDIEELKNTSVGYECFISYIGNDEDIVSVYQSLSKKYNLTSPEYWSSTERDMIIIVWGMVIILMIVMNVIEVIRRKKEVVVRVSLGESIGLIALKAVMSDVLLDIALFLAIKLLLSNFISGNYENRLVIILYLIGIILSVFPYLSFFFFDIRKAFANVTQQNESVILLCALKLVACFATIFTIATNISSIKGNLLANENLLEAYNDANYFTVMSSDFDSDKETMFWETLYQKEYNTLNPAMCINIADDKNDVIFVNYNGKAMLQSFKDKVDKINSTTDVIIFVPKGKSYEKNKLLAYDELSYVFNYSDDELQDLNILYIEYSGTEYFSYLDTNSTDGIGRTKNPIVVYQSNKDLLVNGGNLESYNPGAILFQCDDKQLRDVCSKYENILGTYNVVITNVHKQYMYNHTFLMKFIGFLSSLCIIVILLEVAIIIMVSRLEFRRNAMKISLMKILGYSLFERHKKLLGLIIIENLVVFIGMIIYSMLSIRTSTWICIWVSVFVILVEFTIIFLNIINVEKTSVQKALKGGCL